MKSHLPRRGPRGRVRPSNISDVARHAGVSVGTVSNVLNQPERVNSAMRDRVQRAIDDLGYRPNAMAKKLRERRTMTLGLVLSDITTPFAALLARTAERLASDAGFSVLFADTDEQVERTRRAVDQLSANGVEGMILAPTAGSHGFLEEYSDRSWPMVAVNRKPADIEIPSVLTDHAGGAHGATRHLLDHGHRRIGVVSRPSDVSSIRDRHDGYEAALAEAGVEADPSLVVVEEPSFSGGLRAVERLMGLDEPPSAIMSFSTIMTLGTVVAFREVGIRMPDDVAFISFDDATWSVAVTPPITSVSLGAESVAIEATTMLLEWIESGRPPTKKIIRVDTQLIVRSSCGCSSGQIASELRVAHGGDYAD